MTPQETATPVPLSHEDAWALLPWYVNYTLERLERTRLEKHLVGCPTCQAEVVRCQEIAAVVREDVADAWEPSAAHFARLTAQLDAATAVPPQQRRWWTAGVARVVDVLRGTPVSMRWAFAAQSALVVLLGALVLGRTPNAPAPLYHTLSQAPMPTSQGYAYFRMVFAEEITEKELRALLSAVHGTLVHGPSPFGVYTISSAINAPHALQDETVLQTLRAHPKVRLAEPLPTQ